MINLCIKSFILIDNHDVTLNKGLTSITGETGAGKSIIFEAVRFLSGDRMGANVIKKGKDLAEITAELSLVDFPHLKKLLVEYDLYNESDVILIRRKITSKGQGHAYINDTKVTLTTLKAFGEQIFLIVGQKDAQLLAKPDYQLSLIDKYGKHETEIGSVTSQYHTIKNLEKDLAAALKRKEFLTSHKNLLEYQVEEMDKLSPNEGEYAVLEKEHLTLSNATELSSALMGASKALTGNKGALTSIKGAAVDLGAFGEIEEVANMLKILEDTRIELEEVSSDAAMMGSRISFNPERFKYIDDKIAAYYHLSKKLECKPEQLHIKHEELVGQLNNIKSIDIDSIREKIAEETQVYFALARKLSQSRKSTAIKFSAAINIVLRKLNIRENAFSLDMTEEERVHSKGLNVITYMLQSNAESDRSPLVQSASGGELSRITLALNTIMSEMVKVNRVHFFDEIDTGISGSTASYVGGLLKKLGKAYPVVCITHIPHVGGMADTQLHVTKKDTQDKTITELHVLSGKERIKVIATLLFGDNECKNKLKEAEKLIA